MVVMMSDEKNKRQRDELLAKSWHSWQGRAATIDNSDMSASCRELMRPNETAQRRMSLPTKKSVTFSSMSSLVIFERHSPSPTWYTNRDHQRFKQEIKRDIRSFRHGLSDQTEDLSAPSIDAICPVGIEQHVFSPPDMLETSLLHRKTVAQSVLLEQRRQRVFGYHDPDEIASMCAGLTAKSSEEALLRGIFQESSKAL